MYSHALQKLLNSADAKIRHTISVKHKGKTYNGVLMPSTEMGDPDTLVIKLSNGYNVGLKFEPSMKISKGKTKESKRLKSEVDQELGKRKKLEHLKWNEKKPLVSLIATGGTIASRVDYETGAVTGKMTPDEILSVAPELAEHVYIKDIHSPFTKSSEDMDHKDWKEMAKLAAKEINRGEGVIVTHGTDTLHYTAAALSFMLRNLSKPVVLTGSQRSSDRGSTDAAINLICSSIIAGHGAMAEVGVCMHGAVDDAYCLFIRGTKVRKMDKSRRDTFRPINDIPIAKVWTSGRIEVINDNYRKKSKGEVEADTKYDPNVSIIRIHPDADPEILHHLRGKGYHGFVIEGTGFGHVPTKARKSWIPEIEKTVKDGIPVVITSQALYGRVNQSVYSNARILFQETGAIPAEDMTTETAFVKLGWVLGHTKDIEKVRKDMLTNYAGEISSRTLPESFLY
jgi:glutamyl-tRNA(Gln) amidotransferase subunit D